MGSVVLGKGIMAYASSVAEENEADEEEGEEDDDDDEGEGDWFYSRTAPG
jgi:hypothetical protein